MPFYASIDGGRDWHQLSRARDFEHAKTIASDTAKYRNKTVVLAEGIQSSKRERHWRAFPDGRVETFDQAAEAAKVASDITERARTFLRAAYGLPEPPRAPAATVTAAAPKPAEQGAERAAREEQSERHDAYVKDSRAKLAGIERDLNLFLAGARAAQGRNE